MRVATWNVNGIRARFDDVTAWSEREQPDVFCLQEIKATRAQVPEPLTGLPAYYNHWHGGEGGYSGVSLHVRRDFAGTPKFSVPDFDFEHRVLQVDVADTTILTAYVPNGGKDLDAKLTFLTALRDHVRALLSERERVLVCGDLNVTRSDADVHPKQLKKGAIGQTKKERLLFEAVLDEGLVDTTRQLYPDDDTIFTWWPPWREEKQKNRGWRIDYVLASQALSDRLADCRILKDEGSSDHAPLHVDFS